MFISCVFIISLITIVTFTVTQSTLNPTLWPREAVEFQNWYMERIADSLPLLEQIKSCECPRVYMPVCGTDNKTYTNVCWMHCMNYNRATDVQLYYAGHCLQFLDPFEY